MREKTEGQPRRRRRGVSGLGVIKPGVSSLQRHVRRLNQVERSRHIFHIAPRAACLSQVLNGEKGKRSPRSSPAPRRCASLSSSSTNRRPPQRKPQTHVDKVSAVAGCQSGDANDSADELTRCCQTLGEIRNLQ